MIKIILICLLSFYIINSEGTINTVSGVVEGFYWDQANTVNGQYGSYSFSQRQQLIQILADNGLGVYWYIPQLVNTITLLSSTELQQWQASATLGNSLGVKVIYGIRPGYLENQSSNFTTILNKVKQLDSVGIKYYSLGFDDATGVATSAQQTREVALVNYLEQQLSSGGYNITLWGLTPWCYYQQSVGNMSQWQTALEIIDGINSTIPFIVTGNEITPSSMTTAQFPTLNSGRSFVFWDNWIAVDTSTKIPWGLIDGRVQSSIFSSGYVLNLCFPLERAIHQIKCEGLIVANLNSNFCNVTTVSNYWSNFLNSNGFIHYTNQTVSSVAKNLSTAIVNDDSFTSIAQLEAAYPGILGIFSLPPTLVQTSTTSSSTTSTPTPSQNVDQSSTSSCNIIIPITNLLFIFILLLLI
ncbi:hyaluronidase [Tieghemostelium lacteum]|uniref:Hyaluronidase n=1 Tax=Tieghemostelium lacteum TaxID=361077 RepID=A0A151Z8D5_TIELA|nr:hyaluronidase [Tieghemostelium lacteum]|eukprot:KYQ90233.1 hyaluronidase [Tieghemostelium lacteum]